MRRELILQQEHGKIRVDDILECAEHVITLLSVLAMIQVAENHQVGTRLPTPQLRSFYRDGSLHLDWGKDLALIREGVAYTANHDNPLSLPFPSLGELEAALNDESSDWSQAESKLRKQRNDQSHLQRLPDIELCEMSEEFTQYLDTLLAGIAFLSTTPLALVGDYLLRLTGERIATFHLLQSTSAAFQRREQTVPSEIPRGVVGILDQRGHFYSAFPWLTIPQCKRTALFVFNRFEHEQVTYVAMETGHPHYPPALAEKVKALILSVA